MLFLRPRPGYVPKVLSTSFRSQVVVLQAFSPSPSNEGDDHRLLYPVRALKMYGDRSSQWRKSLQLLVCFGAGRKGLNTQYPTGLGMLFLWPIGAQSAFTSRHQGSFHQRGGFLHSIV